MKTFLNFHTHRAAVVPSETVIRNLSAGFIGNRKEGIPENGWFSAGIHPWYIPEELDSAFESLAVCCGSPRCMALGEAGLDKCSATSFTLQKEVFARQLFMAGAFRLPVTVHCVRAWGELLEVCKTVHPAVPCVVHGFRGGPELARQLLDKGFYLSFGFRFNTQSLVYCPSDRLFLETDENACSVEGLYHTVALLRGCGKEELRAFCWDNLRSVSSKNM